MPAPVTAAPNPNDIRRQFQIDATGQANIGADTGVIAPGIAIGGAATFGARIPIAGAAKIRLRAKTSQAATLRAKFMLADGTTDSASSDNPADVALAAATEASMNITPSGEGWLHVQIVNGATPGVINFVDVSQL